MRCARRSSASPRPATASGEVPSHDLSTERSVSCQMRTAVWFQSERAEVGRGDALLAGPGQERWAGPPCSAGPTHFTHRKAVIP